MPSNWQDPFANAAAKVNTATQRIVICSTRTRPIRSATIPAPQPPTAAPASAAVAR